MRNAKWPKSVMLAAVAALVLPGIVLTAGCNEKKEKREITVEGPNSKYEVEVETTEKKSDKDD